MNPVESLVDETSEEVNNDRRPRFIYDPWVASVETPGDSLSHGQALPLDQVKVPNCRT